MSSIITFVVEKVGQLNPVILVSASEVVAWVVIDPIPSIFWVRGDSQSHAWLLKYCVYKISCPMGSKEFNSRQLGCSKPSRSMYLSMYVCVYIYKYIYLHIPAKVSLSHALVCCCSIF